MATNNPQQTEATNVAVDNNAGDPGEMLLAKAKANKKRIRSEERRVGKEC